MNVIQQLVIGILLLMLLSVGASFASGPTIHWEQLDLSPSQKNHIQDLDSQWKAIYNQLAPPIRQKEVRLMNLMGNPTSNEGDIADLQNEINADKVRLKQQATELFLSKRKCLRPDQKRRLMDMMHK